MPKKTEYWGLICAAAIALPNAVQAADAFTDALTGGKASGNFRLRYEEVMVDSTAIHDASALTLRSRLGYETAPFSGFTAMLELEDTHVVNGMDQYSPETTDPLKPATNPYTYAAIVDPERTEINRAYLRYRGVPNSIWGSVGSAFCSITSAMSARSAGVRTNRLSMPLPRNTMVCPTGVSITPISTASTASPARNRFTTSISIAATIYSISATAVSCSARSPPMPISSKTRSPTPCCAMWHPM